MTRNDDLIRTVVADLKYIKNEWGQEIDDDSLRRGSTTLRKLLEGDLLRAWRAAGFLKSPTIYAVSLSNILKRFKREDIICAATGGAQYGGGELQDFHMLKAPPSPPAPSMNNDPPPRVAFGLPNFIKAPCMLIHGNEIPRLVLVQYVANKLGGAHLDHSRGFKGKEKLFHLLDWARGTIGLLGKDIVSFKLLACGQAVASSKDLEDFINVGSSQRIRR